MWASVQTNRCRLLVLMLCAALTACSTYGSKFESKGLQLFIPGVTTRMQADEYLRGAAYKSYQQLDGSETVVWLQRTTLATDAVYFNQELWLQFDTQGRFVRVVKRDNIPLIYTEQEAPRPVGSVTIESEDSDIITIHPVTR